MTQPGFGAMIHMLTGGTRHSASEYHGRVVTDAKFVSDGQDSILLTFTDGVTIKITDEGQSCCENRYMKTDDDISSLVGQTIMRIEAKEGPTEKGEYDEEHEVVFLEIGGDRSFVTFSFHNEHNGYYGGFGLNIDEVTR